MERGSSHGYRCRHLVVGFRMHHLGVDMGSVRKEIVEVLRKALGSVREMDQVRHREVEGFEVGMMSFVRSLVLEDRRYCLECMEVVGGMVVEVGIGWGFHHHRSFGLTCCLVCLCCLFLLYSYCIVRFDVVDDICDSFDDRTRSDVIYVQM